MTDSLSPFSALYRCSWYKVTVQLQNIRNTYARRHPLFIFHAIFLSAAKNADLSLDPAFCFHPVDRQMPDRMYKQMQFDLELVFPHYTEQEVHSFLTGLNRHLGNRDNNFRLLDIGDVQKRTLHDVENEFYEQYGIPEDEICLNFLTPFSFTPKKKHRNWLIRQQDFFKSLQRRIRLLCDMPPADEQWLTGQVRLLPYYWNFHSFGIKKSTCNKGCRSISGVTGRLYVRGEISTIMPMLLFCSELHLASVTKKNHGQKTRLGLGYYMLRKEVTYFDPQLASGDQFFSMIRSLEQKDEFTDEIARTYLDQTAALQELHQEISTGSYEPGVSQGFYIDKPRGGKRLIATLPARDYLVHKYLYTILSRPMERMFEDASIGFRKNRSRETARIMIREACSEGCRYVLESDVESFFDHIDWDIMLDKLAAHLPRGDRLTLDLVTRVLKGPLDICGKRVQREKGVLTGSPLSPLLSNLYLDSFDEEMEKLGFRLIRYGDDFLVLTRTREEAEHALRAIETILADIKLTVKDEKTSTTAVDLGFSFLGLSFDAEMDEDFVDGVPLASPLYIRNHFYFAGIDGNSIVIRQKGTIVARMPVTRVSEIVVLGTNMLSSSLLQRCVRERIPVSICSPMGWYYATLKPDSKQHYLISRNHADRFDALDEEEQTSMAARLVMAKIHNYLHWLKSRWPAEAHEVITTLEMTLSRLSKVDRVERIRGLEGNAARSTFTFVSHLCKESVFHSRERLPRKRHDPYNSLLDFGYSLLFTRINVLLRGQGLNPYLGILHSSKDSYESLVCDLQEPFRGRIDRFIVKTVNRSVVRPEHIECRENGQFWLTREGTGLFLEAFEREMEVRLAGDGGTLGQLLAAQVRAVCNWVEEDLPLHFYRAGTSRSSPVSIRQIIPDMSAT